MDRRPYITVTNELFRHPKFLRLTPAAKIHLLELWAHCNEYRTDGVVEAHILNQPGKKLGKELLTAGWVEPSNTTDIYLMHDYLDHQPSRAEIEQRMAKKSAAGAQGGHVQWHEKKGVKKEGCYWCENPEPPETNGT